MESRVLMTAAQLADWTFETSQPVTAGPLSAESAFYSSGTTTQATGSHTASTTYSTPAGNGSSHSFSSNGWSVGDYYQFKTSASGFQGITFNWDQTSSNTGPRDFNLQYSTDGTTFTTFGSTHQVQANASPNPVWNATTSSSLYSSSVDLSSVPGLNNAATVYFRLVDNSTTSANGTTVAAAGTDRVDNVSIVANNTTTSSPIIGSVSPTSGGTPGGTTVTINGVNLTGTTAVSFGGTPGTNITNVSDSQITVTAPSHAAAQVDVLVTNGSGSSSATAFDKYTFTNVAPTVTNVSPTSGPDSGGTPVTITGTSFSSATGVTFGGVAATSFTINSDTSISAVAPAGTNGSTVDVVVTNGIGPSAAVPADHFSYTLTTIAAAEALPSGSVVTLDNNPVITKILTVGGGNVVNGLTYGSWAFLINDGTGSLEVFSTITNGYTPTVGDALSISGTFSPFDQIPELGTITSISAISHGNTAGSDPLLRTIAQVKNNPLPSDIAGHLVELDNVTITGEGSSFGNTNSPSGAKITDSSGNMTLFYWPTSYSRANQFFFGTPVPTGPVNLLGIVDVFSGTPEFIPIEEPNTTFDKFSMTDNATVTGEFDGFHSINRNSSVMVTVHRDESTDNGTIQYTVIPDSAAAGTDYTYNGGTNVTGTLNFPAGTSDVSFTITTLNPVTSGDKLFSVQLSNATSDGTGFSTNVVGAVSSGPQTIVINDPNSHHTVANNSFQENATVQVTGPRHNSGSLPANDNGILFFQSEADNVANDGTLKTPPTTSEFESYGVLTYNDWDGSSGDGSHILTHGSNTVGAINGVEIEGVGAPQSFAADGQMDVYLTTDTSTDITFNNTSLTYDKTSLPNGVGSSFGTKYLLGTFNYSASQAGGVFTPFNLNVAGADPNALTILKNVLNGSSASSAQPFRIIVANHDALGSLSWEGSTIVNGVDQSPILRISYSAPSSLPAWLAPGSAATWSAPNLTVTGSATIIADPGADEPIITASGAAAQISVQPTNSDEFI
ncbi:MAG TPA: IPT/TIG domain-containing protein, partial [Humisphaera sp.]|nr:IPT/TIG domain-containing protein [Humisphaera sp.]